MNGFQGKSVPPFKAMNDLIKDVSKRISFLPFGLLCFPICFKSMLIEFYILEILNPIGRKEIGAVFCRTRTWQLGLPKKTFG
jgi:hypothetical protein